MRNGSSLLMAAAVVFVSARPTAQQQQSPAAVTLVPEFEVASVKPASKDLLLRRGLNCGFRRDGFVAFGSASWLIACAYGIPAGRAKQQIVGAPKWVDEDLFEIQAKTSTVDLQTFTPEQRLQMIRTLLADRFRLAVHYDTKQVDMYALGVDRKDGQLGPRIHPTTPECAAFLANGRKVSDRPIPHGDELPCGSGRAGPSIISQTAMPMTRLADALSPRVERPVQDRTGLTGSFAFTLEWKPLTATNDNEPADLPTSIFTALREQLGLRLEPTKGPVEVLVVDHIERPTPD